MLRIHEIRSADAATNYFVSQDRSDYYTGAPDKPGIWTGKAAAMLGLKGVVEAEHFAALCRNQNPATFDQLTMRNDKGRRVAYDFNFHPPKSVSVLYSLTFDEKIKRAVENAIAETIDQIEAEMKTRARKNGADYDRISGNLMSAIFMHDHGRPTEDSNGRVIPDPHLHGHAVIMNATYDAEEGCWKAIQVGDIKRDAPYFEACFHSRLIQSLQGLGYDIERLARGWEISGLADGVLGKFSTRTQDVKQARLDEELLLGKKLSERQAAELGKRSRRLKSEGEKLSPSQLHSAWTDRLSEQERNSIFECSLRARAKRGIYGINQPNLNEYLHAKEASEFAIGHCFETQSVLDNRRVMTEAIRAAFGKAPHSTVEQTFESSPLLRYEENGRTWCTTKEVLSEEKRFINFCRNGRATKRPFVEKLSRTYGADLSDQQRLAMRHILQSHDRVIGLRGKAGTGKTTMMNATVAALEKTGNRVFTFAPTSGAVEVLKEEGFDKASTIQSFLKSNRSQHAAAGSVLWIDEAGLLSSKQMARLADIAEEQGCRIVLSGDKGQHSGVERGDALRILEAYGGLRPAQLDQIFRQRDPVYRGAVQNLAEGQVDQAFEKLSYLGSFKQVRDDLRAGALAVEYLNSLKAGRTALVVSPTHAEANEVTHYIRRQLIKTGELTPVSYDCQQLKSKRLTASERSQLHHYAAGQVIETHGAISREIPIGSRCEVLKVDDKGVWVSSKGRRVLLDLAKADNFDVYEREMLFYHPGDRIRITRNGKSMEGKKLINNTFEKIDSFGANGEVVLKSGKTLPQDYGHFAPGYCVTSHSSQGSTVDDVFIAESSQSFPAASLEQFYVSTSRGRNKVKIYTDSVSDLKEAIRRSCKRRAAYDYRWDPELKLQSSDLSQRQQAIQKSRDWLDQYAEPLSDPPLKPPLPIEKNLSPDAAKISGRPLREPVISAAKPQPPIENDR